MKILIENFVNFHYEIIETIINKYDMLFNILKNEWQTNIFRKT